MPKTATKAKKKVTAKPITKKSAKTVSHTPVRAKSSAAPTWWDTYCTERDAFYKKHPSSQWLMAILILVILVYIGLYYWSQTAMMPM